MGEVGVHLEHLGRARGERAMKAGQVRRAEALAHRPVQDLDLREPRGQLVGDGARPVGRIVVDDE